MPMNKIASLLANSQESGCKKFLLRHCLDTTSSYPDAYVYVNGICAAFSNHAEGTSFRGRSL